MVAFYTLEYDSNDSHSRSSEKVGAKVGQMGLFHSHGVAKFGVASLLIGTLHFFEDIGLLFAGRYTDINIITIIAGGILFSICVAGIFKLTWVQKHLL